ncbi:TonB-dependent receptor [Methylopila sp. 73B]|uniref:TonB-dependent receptor n=1 Tax=Methylopila sp. 73B TaxID=1120792 RepID=UPI0012DF7C68|nr:TonB-dependent receptor [Methylopila sp. 73B]
MRFAMGRGFRLAGLGAWLLGASALTAAPTQAQQASETTYRFDVAAKPLAAAIADVGATSGWRIAYAAPLPAGAQSRPLSGVYSTPQALTALLGDTPFGVRVVGPRAATLYDRSAAAVPSGVDAGDAILIGPVEVTANAGSAGGPGWQGASDDVYETPAGVAQVGRQAIDERGGARNTADILRSVSGLNTVVDRQNPGVNVNIRGLQDQGRVNMSIDGARQNFQQAGHGSTAYVYVDPELLSRVDVEKGATSTAGGAGVIGGVVNFRTLDASDVILDGKTWGGRVNATTGTNAFDFNGSAALAARPTDTIEVLGAVGRKKLGEYKVGKRGEALDERTSEGGSTPVADFVTQDQWSWLLKATAEVAENHRITLSYIGLNTDFGTGSGQYVDTNTVENHTATAAWRWTPGGPWVDLDAKAYYTRTSDDQFRPERRSADGLRVTTPAARVDYAIDTFGGSIQNTSRFELAGVHAAVTYGGEYFHDKTDTASAWANPAFDPDNVQFSGSNPNGKRGVGSAFGQIELTHADWLQVIGGLRYDRYDLSGSGLVFSELAGNAFLPFHVDRSQGRLSPTATVAVTPLAGVQVYGSYKQGFRPPTIMETLLGGSHIGGFIYFAPNPNLKAEISETWEAGVNLKFDGVLREDDAFRAKISIYSTEVKNFVTQATISNGADGYYFANVNLNNPAKLKGLDLEANYDAGTTYIGASVSLIDGTYDEDYDSGGYAYPSLQSLYLAPKTKVAIDGGFRFFERKLTVGGRLTRVVPEDMLGAVNTQSPIYRPYLLLDAYASYKLNDNVTVRAAIENITDRAYVDAMASQLTASPGRTATLGVTARF